METVGEAGKALIVFAGIVLLVAALVRGSTSGVSWLLFWWRIRKLLLAVVILLVLAFVFDWEGDTQSLHWPA